MERFGRKCGDMVNNRRSSDDAGDAKSAPAKILGKKIWLTASTQYGRQPGAGCAGGAAAGQLAGSSIGDRVFEVSAHVEPARNRRPEDCRRRRAASPIAAVGHAAFQHIRQQFDARAPAEREAGLPDGALRRTAVLAYGWSGKDGPDRVRRSRIVNCIRRVV